MNKVQGSRFTVQGWLVLWLVFLTSASSHGQQVSLPAKSNSVKFAVIGDMGTGHPAQYETAKQMAEMRQRFPFDFVIMLGDNLYHGNGPGDFERKFEDPYKPLLDAGVKFYASLGNHDGPNERYYKPFNMNGASYYTFKKGNVRLFALDSNYMDPKQLDWLRKQLDNSGDEWKICFFHHPLYSSARKHGSSNDLRVVLEPLFVQDGVNVVFSGHDHVYERIQPQNGIYYFVEGASGELRRGDLRQSKITSKGFDADRTFMLVEITGDEMYFQTISRTGEVVDSGAMRRTRAKNAVSAGR